MFQLDEKQYRLLTEWMDKHEIVYEGAIGGRYTYMFTPTTLGLGITVRDNITKDKIDLTDYESW